MDHKRWIVIVCMCRGTQSNHLGNDDDDDDDFGGVFKALGHGMVILQIDPWCD